MGPFSFEPGCQRVFHQRLERQNRFTNLNSTTRQKRTTSIDGQQTKKSITNFRKKGNERRQGTKLKQLSLLIIQKQKFGNSNPLHHVNFKEEMERMKRVIFVLFLFLLIQPIGFNFPVAFNVIQSRFVWTQTLWLTLFFGKRYTKQQINIKRGKGSILKKSGFGITQWKPHEKGIVHDSQSSRVTSTVVIRFNLLVACVYSPPVFPFLFGFNFDLYLSCCEIISHLFSVQRRQEAKRTKASTTVTSLLVNNVVQTALITISRGKTNRQGKLPSF